MVLKGELRVGKDPNGNFDKMIIFVKYILLCGAKPNIKTQKKWSGPIFFYCAFGL